ncbi:MAG: hypothetical protein ONB12_10550, partial [candidate division KSB1 bacterium]|nr:hypothetical protein [candidate division KSB1 bacterium]
MPHQRYYFFRKVMTAALALLILRLAWVQLIARGRYLSLAENQHHLIVQLPAERGRILDRNGVPLAVNLPVVTVVANADSIRDVFRFAHRLAALTHQPADEIIAKLRGSKGWVEVARNLPLEVKERIEQADLDFVGCREELQRSYPKGRAGAHVVGFTRNDGVGAYGMELSCETLLRGRRGKAVLLKTGRARVFTSPFH